MIGHTPNTVQKKRKLNKIRGEFTRRNPASENLPYFDYSTFYLHDNTIDQINASFGIIEENRSILVDLKALSACYQICGSSIQDHFDSKAVMVNLSRDKQYKRNSWNYIVKRFQSFGDVEGLTWAKRIARNFEEIPAIMGKYNDSCESDDDLIQIALRKYRNGVKVACQDLEQQYPYRKICSIIDGQGFSVVSVSYNEALADIMGYTLEELSSMDRGDQIPLFLDLNNPPHYMIAQRFVENLLTGQLAQEGPECIIEIDKKNGEKKKVMVKYLILVEPGQDVLFTNWYLIIKDTNPLMEEEIDNKTNKTNKREQ